MRKRGCRTIRLQARPGSYTYWQSDIAGLADLSRAVGRCVTPKMFHKSYTFTRGVYGGFALMCFLLAANTLFVSFLPKIGDLEMPTAFYYLFAVMFALVGFGLLNRRRTLQRRESETKKAPAGHL